MDSGLDLGTQSSVLCIVYLQSPNTHQVRANATNAGLQVKIDEGDLGHTGHGVVDQLRKGRGLLHQQGSQVDPWK